MVGREAGAKEGTKSGETTRGVHKENKRDIESNIYESFLELPHSFEISPASPGLALVRVLVEPFTSGY